MSTPRRHSRALLNEHPLLVLPSLVRALDRNHLAALFVQQVHYWLQRSTNVRDGAVWTYHTYEEWATELVSTPSTIYRLVQKLEAQGLIRTTAAYNKRPADHTLWYTLNYEALNGLLADGLLADNLPSHDFVRPSMQNDETNSATCLDDLSNVTRALPETITETPSEITPPVGVGVVDDPPVDPPPPPPPPQKPKTTPTTDAPPPLPALAVQRFRALYPARASPALDARIRRDVIAAVGNGLGLAPAGLEHALLEAADKKDPWEFAIKVWRAKPTGPQGAPHAHLDPDRPPAGGPAGRAAHPATPTAADVALVRALGGTLPDLPRPAR